MDNIKAFNVRMPKEMWVFLKKQSLYKEKPMNVIINYCLEKYKKTCEKTLTLDNDLIS